MKIFIIPEDAKCENCGNPLDAEIKGYQDAEGKFHYFCSDVCLAANWGSEMEN